MKFLSCFGRGSKPITLPSDDEDHKPSRAANVDVNGNWNGTATEDERGTDVGSTAGLRSDMADAPSYSAASNRGDAGDQAKGGVGPDGKKDKCVFCDVKAEKGFDIVYEAVDPVLCQGEEQTETDDELIAFHDRWPRAREHILIIPRRHVVGTVPELRTEHIGMIERMQARALALRPDSDVRLGFHIPPFSSIHHLHLHVLVPPLSRLGHLQYRVRGREGPGGDGGKKWTWFVTPSQVISILQAGRTVGLGSVEGGKA